MIKKNISFVNKKSASIDEYFKTLNSDITKSFTV